ncbi:MAG TPA: substrate-binding domain-containing protein [Terriglobales bacterium]|nr:substrate-binding domain-containing protein [Terriglobales bacterium]
MKKLRILASLTTHDNDYQREQAASLESGARKLGVDLQIVYANNDAINQSQQLLKVIQGPADARPDAIMLEPVGTGLPQVAKAAVAVGIGWVVMNRDVDYLTELRRSAKMPVFGLSSDHNEVGRIQGRQFGILTEPGQCVLYIEGPTVSDASRYRTSGMNTTKPPEIEVKTLKGSWTETSAYNAVSSWLKLSTSRNLPVGVVGCQNDAMAIGARRAFQELTKDADRERWLRLPFTGCDGLPGTGQTYVRRGSLTATVVIPALGGHALEMLVKAVQTGSLPPERTLTVPSSYPSLEELKSNSKKSMAVKA